MVPGGMDKLEGHAEMNETEVWKLKNVTEHFTFLAAHQLERSTAIILYVKHLLFLKYYTMKLIRLLYP